MHRSEASELDSCASCGEDVAAEDRSFPFGNESMLCFRCAIERGGIYDEHLDHWDRRPDVVDLLERDKDA